MNNQNKQIREMVGNYFGLSLGSTPWKLYFGMLNENGKISARSMLDLIALILEYLDEKDTPK